MNKQVGKVSNASNDLMNDKRKFENQIRFFQQSDVTMFVQTNQSKASDLKPTRET